MSRRIRLKAFVATEDLDFDEAHTLDAFQRYTAIVRTGASVKMTRPLVWQSAIVNVIISDTQPVIEDLT